MGNGKPQRRTGAGGQRRQQHRHRAAAADTLPKYPKTVPGVLFGRHRHRLEFPQEEEWDSFSLLRGQLKQLLSSQPQPIALSVALYPQQNQLNAEAMQALDRVHLMAYDQFDQQGFHSTLQTAQEAVEQLLQQGADVGQLSLGIPAYGRPLDASAQWIFYKDIPQDISRENPDLDGEIFFNSAATAAAKTQFACDSKLGGVMLYHLLCDRTGPDSLVAACRSAID